MTNGNDSAFPEVDTTHTFQGLTKREWMVTHLLAGMMSENPTTAMSMPRLAEEALRQTDYLIEALNKESK